ncbi:MAG TPA: tyrosine-type recombinase/integrase [Solirubrobacter sp.]|nr:tyrosine-type recombinase/integrase [Solirubrobacter sp.]
MQHGQIFELKTAGPGGQRLWAYRYRLDGRGSRRIQRGGYTSADDARDALQQALTAAQRRNGRVRVTPADLAEEYLAQHDGQPETTTKLRWLLTKSTAVFGATPLTELDAREIAAWRMTLPAGHRFEATQALRQTLARAVEWGLLDINPAKTGVDNPQPPRREMRPFDSDDQLKVLAAELGPLYGPMVQFAAATGLRPGEWIALEHRDIDRDEGLVYVCRAFRVDRLKPTKTNTARAVPLQRSALDALDQIPSPRGATSLLFPAPEGGYLDLHNWRPAIGGPRSAPRAPPPPAGSTNMPMSSLCRRRGKSLAGRADRGVGVGITPMGLAIVVFLVVGEGGGGGEASEQGLQGVDDGAVGSVR